MTDIGKIADEIKSKYPDVGIKSIEVDADKGKSTFYLEPNKKTLAFLDKASKISPITSRLPSNYSKASTINRDTLSRTSLDLAISRDAYDENPQELYRRAFRYHYTDPWVGSTNSLLASLACKGFSLDIDDENIKNFYESWVFDVGFEQILDYIFTDFFKIGQVYPYKIIAKYEPKISYLSTVPGKKSNKSKGIETGAAKNIWSKGHLPVAYTILNPLLVNIEGNLLFNKTSIKLTLPTELKDILDKDSSELSLEEKELIKILPPQIKKAADTGEEFLLDSRLVSTISYRKPPYERYARPRSSRVMDSIEYKRALRQADISTVDGISNYILKVTIGSDEHPITTQEELEAVASLFNTTSKSFDVVWNHTLNVEKIVSPEIEAILGQDKYAQVNDDISVGLAISRALLDGGGNGSAAELSLVVKGIMEEINYARRQVTNWIYKEFQQIAEAMKFDRFPKVRWDNGVLKDTIMYMATISQLVDRRMLSYRTALETLNFDYPNELRNMEEEFPLVDEGIFGIIGSPWQQTKTQDVQKAPEGTPSNGRPKGQPTGKNDKETNPQKKVKDTVKNPKQEESSLKDIVKDLDNDEFLALIDTLGSFRN